MELDEKARWNRKYSEVPHASLEPDPFLVSTYDEFLSAQLPGHALDVAGGAGRHAIWLADRGWNVKLVDISEVGIDMARKRINNANRGDPSLSGKVKGSVDTEGLDLNSVRDLG